MYCKHCGQVIAEDSKFCQHCGRSQRNCNGGVSLSNKPVWIIYIIWAAANFYLLMGEKNLSADDAFFPWDYRDEWCPYNKRYYDVSEFLVYVFLLPGVIFLIYKYRVVLKNKILTFVGKLKHNHARRK